MTAMKILLFVALSVAVELVAELANCQGPPLNGGYVVPIAGPPPPPPYPGRPVGYYGPPGEYESKDPKGFKEFKEEKGGYKKAKEYEKEYEKQYEKDYKKGEESPGMLGSFSNTMSDAWSK